MRQFQKMLQELRRSTSGAAMVETAVVAPLLALVMMGTIDIASYGAAKLRVQQAINRGLEMAMMGGPGTPAESIENEVEAEAGVADGTVTVTQTQTCGGASAAWDSTCASGEERRRFVTIAVAESFTPYFVAGVLADRRDDEGRIDISATGVIRVQ